jgi:GNAT superfamily N-acetyltransferase
MRNSAGERARWADDRTTGHPTKAADPAAFCFFGKERPMDDLTISFDLARVDRDRVYGWLSREAYWSPGLDRAVFERAVAHSLVASAFVGDEQVGFARVVTDCATFAWLCDVFVAATVRGRGVGQRLIGALVDHPDLQGLRRWSLRTRDAHGLYQRVGFTPLTGPERCMERHNPQAGASQPALRASSGDTP